MNPGLLRKAPAAKEKAQRWRNNVLDRTSIARKIGPADEHSFDGLRSEGIKLVQDLSGSIWTDYNLHDPGVTILEQLCYALTDLINRAESDIPDYLTGSNRQINFEQQALFNPRTIFLSGPVTINDYRKIIFDGVPELDNVWITKVDDESGQGLYHVYAQMQTPDELSETQLEQAKTDVIDQITKIYSAHRNLCEDLKDVTVVEHVHYSLHGEVEIGGDREPPDILSEIYFKTSQFMASSIPFHSYEEVLSGGENLEEVFSGRERVPGRAIDQSSNEKVRIENALELDSVLLFPWSRVLRLGLVALSVFHFPSPLCIMETGCMTAACLAA